MFLIALKNVRYQRTFWWQEATRYFQGFTVPKLAFCFYLRCVDLKFLLTISQESQFGADTKIRNSQERYLFNHAISTEFNVNLLVTVEVKYS
jgi:hypothetical protein